MMREALEEEEVEDELPRPPFPKRSAALAIRSRTGLSEESGLKPVERIIYKEKERERENGKK